MCNSQRRSAEREGGRNWDSSIDTLPCVKLIPSGKLLHSRRAQLGAPWQTRGVGWKVVGGRLKEGGCVYIVV